MRPRTRFSRAFSKKIVFPTQLPMASSLRSSSSLFGSPEFQMSFRMVVVVLAVHCRSAFRMRGRRDLLLVLQVMFWARLALGLLSFCAICRPQKLRVNLP